MMAPRERVEALEVVAHLVELARLDPVYRDLYVGHARAHLAGVLSPGELDRLRRLEPGLGRAEQDARGAVLAGDWARVKQLAAGIKATRDTLAARRDEMRLAAAVYDPGEVSLDPFSPGLAQLLPGHPSPSALLITVRDHLRALAELAPETSALCAARRRYFDALDSTRRPDGAPRVETGQIELQAIDALQHGRFDDLGRLAQRMLTAAGPAASGEAGAVNDDGRLADPFPADAVARGGGLGLSPALLEAEPVVADFVHRVAWTPAFAEIEHTRDGATRVEAALADPALRRFRETARETLALFAMHPYLNSGGARYLPRPVAETVLIEDFAESAEPPLTSPLLEALALPRRRGLARVEIERALLVGGPDVVERLLGLDPVAFQLVCVPPDVYSRAGAGLGWGRSPLWTHFDGYQLMRTGHLRALVGGDVRYGGRADLVSIARDDARDKVVLRLAVVRRERMLGQWV